MKVSLPNTQQWTPEYQERLNAELQRYLEPLTQYGLVPEGGTAGQALVKASGRSRDLTWGTATGTDSRVDGLITDLDTLETNLAALDSGLDAEIAARQADVANLQSQVNSLAEATAATVFVQASEPVPGVGGVPDPIPDGARWFDTDDNNKPYIWDGTALEWVSLEDPRIGANAAAITALQVDMVAAEGDIAANASALSTLDTTVSSLSGTVSAQGSSITNLQSSLATTNGNVSTNASAISGLDTRVTAAEGVNTSQASSISSLTSRITAAEGVNTSQATAISSLTTRVTNTETTNTTQATQITALQSESASAIAGVSANSTAISALDTRVTVAEGEIDAQALDITSLDSRITNAEGINTTQATALSSLTTRVTNVEGVNSAQATQLTNLSTTVGENTASISTFGASIDGIEAKYTVKIDINGYVTGYGLIADANTGTPTSEFIVLADKFSVVHPSYPKIIPFQVTGGVCYMQNVIIGGALIADLTVGKLTTGTFPNGQTWTHLGDLNLGTTGRVRGGKTGYGVGTGFYFGYSGGQYVLDVGSANVNLRWNGANLTLTGANIDLVGSSYTRKLGVNFGASSQFIDWFGPNAAAINEDNALFYIKNDGSAYFGGDILKQYRPVAWGRYSQTDNNTHITHYAWNCSISAIGSSSPGRTRITFSTARPSTNYIVVANGAENVTGDDDIPNAVICMPYRHLTTYFMVGTRNASGAARNADQVSFIVFAPD